MTVSNVRRTPGPRRVGVEAVGARVNVAKQLWIVLVAVAVYFGVRGITAGEAGLASTNATWLVSMERSVGVFFEVDLQRLLLEHDAVINVVNWIYIWGHWPVIVAVLGWLLLRVPQQFLIYRNALLISGLIGMVMVAAFPVAPPRLMDLGFVDTVAERSNAYRVLQPPAFTNQFAAMPSFHVGWDLLMGIALIREGRHAWVRAIGWVLPILMFFSVVISGNHYFVDAIVGDTIVMASLALASVLATRRSPGRGRPSPSTTAREAQNVT